MTSSVLRCLLLTAEFLNRISDVIIFRPLSQVSLREIVRHQVKDLASRLEDRSIDVITTPAALDMILKESWNPAYGARPMRRYIEKHIATDLSRLVIAGKLPDHSLLEISANTTGFAYKVTPKAVQMKD